jgi:hypothetical protein
MSNRKRQGADLARSLDLRKQLTTVRSMLHAARAEEKARPGPEKRGAIAYWERREADLLRELGEGS